MDLFETLLIPLSNRDILKPDNTLANSLRLSSFFSSKLYFIIPAAESPEIETKLAQTKWAHYSTFIHKSSGNFSQDILNIIEKVNHPLVFLGTNEVSFLQENNHLTWEEEIIQNIQLPIIICPVTLNLSKKPFESLLVPMSGETRMNTALQLAIRIADQMKMPIDLMHVTTRSGVCTDSSLVGHLSDHFYHEYPRLIDQLISKGSPFSSLRERRLIREFWHSCGDKAGEILKHTLIKKTALLVLEWKGIFLRGHAFVVKSILATCNHPILLVRESCQEDASLLKVSKNFSAS